MTQEEEIAHLKKQLSEVLEGFTGVLEQLSKAQKRESQYLEQVSTMQAEQQALNEQLAEVKQQIRPSQAVQMDETGWREDGSNGYVWCACTPQLRDCEYHHSRGSEGVKAVLGASFEGVLGSDFYASYNVYTGLHQRCWVHLLRDRHELTEQYPDDADVQQWAKDVKALYDRAVAYAGPDPSLPAAEQESARRKQQRAFEHELWQLCAHYAHTSSPLHTLCEHYHSCYTLEYHCRRMLY